MHNATVSYSEPSTLCWNTYIILCGSTCGEIYIMEITREGEHSCCAANQQVSHISVGGDLEVVVVSELDAFFLAIKLHKPQTPQNSA